MRMGLDVQEACVKAIQRVDSLRPKKMDVPKMYQKLIVGVCAMDANGKVETTLYFNVVSKF